MPRDIIIITRALALAAAVTLAAACSDAPTAPPSDARRHVPGAKALYAALSTTDLGTLGGFANATDVNAPGQVAGVSAAEDGNDHAFVWQSGEMHDINPPWAARSLALAINGRGQVTGTATDAAGVARAFLWDNGAVTDLGTFGGSRSDGADVNALGAVVGTFDTADGPRHAFLWSAGTVQDLGAPAGENSVAKSVNDAGQVVGFTYAPGSLVEHTFLWQNGTMHDLGTFGGSSSEPAAINDVGQIVGEYWPAGPAIPFTHAFLWQNGAAQDLGTFGGFHGRASGINDLGQIVGSAVMLDGQHAILWQDGEARDLGTPTGGWSADANGIDDLGHVVGKVDGPVGTHAVMWTVAIRAAIDVVPADATNTIKLSSKGAVTVDVFGGKYFDATRIDPATVTLGNEDGNDTAVIRRRDGTLAALFKDLNRDGFPDLELQFDVTQLKQRGDLTSTTARLVLTGGRNDSRQVRGVSMVHVI
jgi:probable HAF family extracellular repeat protein